MHRMNGRQGRLLACGRDDHLDDHRPPVTLYGFEDGARVVVVGSWGGAATDPSWVRNLRANPLAKLRRGREVCEVAAHEAGGAERDRLWELVTAAFPLYATYQRRTSRLIPLFVLEPAGAPG
jgi:deazaflavin-dependent oxidoreductase (nitroreductase family)